MNTNYFKVDAEMIAGLRVLADALNQNELFALVAMFGLRSAQGCNIDMVTCGDVEPGEIDQSRECMADMASDMMSDMLNSTDLKAAIMANDLGDYSVEFQTRVVAVKRKV